jgi:hypothetical protein
MAKRIIEQLLDAAGVRRVVSIDDMYADRFPVEEALALVAQLGPEATKDIFSNYPQFTGVPETDIRNREIRDIWAQIDIAARRRLMTLLEERTGVPQEETPNEVIDEKAVATLPELFGKYGLATLSLGDWRKGKTDFVNEEMPPTFIMVDEDFSREGGGANEGINLTRELLAAPNPERILCALLSHRYGAEKIHDDWEELSKKEKFDKSKFVLIPKLLLTEDPIGFARLVKLAILNGSVNKLKLKVLAILDKAKEEARSQLDAIDIYDFDQIVFRSSNREGVWELDTLFRVFELFHGKEARKLAREDEELRNFAAEIRRISQIPTNSRSAPSYKTIEVQRLELYEDGAYLNSQLTPIDVGDIFQKTSGVGKRYILLAQSCDLMVRPEGVRNPFINEAIVAEIVTLRPKHPDDFGELKFLDPNNEVPSFVDFKRTYSIRLIALDFCAFQLNGEAKFEIGSGCPDRAIPAWKEHHAKISGEVEKLLTRVEMLQKQGVKLAFATALVAKCSNEGLFSPKVDLPTNTLSYGMKRIGRLKQPRAAALLSRYANFMARQAFDHDFGEPERAETAQPEAAKELPEHAEASPRPVSEAAPGVVEPTPPIKPSDTAQ